MPRTAIVTDSTSYLTDEERENLGIYRVPLNVIFGEEAYAELEELSVEQFYEKVKNSPELPKTSQPSAGTFAELFETLKEKGFEAVVVFTLSSEISGTFQSAKQGADMVDGIDIKVFDSEISCIAQGFYVLEAARMAQEGATASEIVARAEEIRKNGVKAYFMVDDLSHLRRGGRLGATQFFVGSLLQVKPVLSFENKRIVPKEKIRTKKKALRQILNWFDEDAQKGDRLVAGVIHANRKDDAEKMAQDIRDRYSNVEVRVSFFGPVIATHVGEGTLGLTWYRP